MANGLNLDNEFQYNLELFYFCIIELNRVLVSVQIIV